MVSVAIPRSFTLKKKKILQQLAIPPEQYDDLSPKGSIDEGIRDLIDEINALEACVTTSSCAGRISVFLEGEKRVEIREMKTEAQSICENEAAQHDPRTGNQLASENWHSQNENENDSLQFPNSQIQSRTKSAVQLAGVGGKGGGGRWLFVSHDPIPLERLEGSLSHLLGMEDDRSKLSSPQFTAESRLIHFKFEPMILHVLTGSHEQAQIVISAALQAGFRESGAINLLSNNLEGATPLVGVRSMGLAFESVVGFESEAAMLCTAHSQLRAFVDIANKRFVENTKRIDKFRILLKDMTISAAGTERKGKDGGEWEDASLRKERKRAEGLERAKAMTQEKSGIKFDYRDNATDLSDLSFMP